MLLRHPLAKPVSMIPPTPRTDVTRLKNQHNKWTKTHASILYTRIPGHSLQTKLICLCKIYTNNLYVTIIEKLCSNHLMWASLEFNHQWNSTINGKLWITIHIKIWRFYMTPIQPNILGCLFLMSVQLFCNTYSGENSWYFHTMSNGWYNCQNFSGVIRWHSMA